MLSCAGQEHSEDHMVLQDGHMRYCTDIPVQGQAAIVQHSLLPILDFLQSVLLAISSRSAHPPAVYATE